MPTNVELLRDMTATNNDDYFEDDTLVEYLNMAYREVISTLTQIEKQRIEPLTALDQLREESSVDLGSITFTNVHDLYYADTDINDNVTISYVEFDGLPLEPIPRQILEEQVKSIIKEINWGHLVDTEYEGWWNHRNTQLYLYLLSEPTAGETLLIHSLTDPTDLVIGGTGLNDLPDRFLNLVLYKAAHLMVIQENIKSVQDMNPSYYELYENELQRLVY